MRKYFFPNVSCQTCKAECHPLRLQTITGGNRICACNFSLSLLTSFLMAAGVAAFEAVRALAACMPQPLGTCSLSTAAALRLVTLAKASAPRCACAVPVLCPCCARAVLVLRLCCACPHLVAMMSAHCACRCRCALAVPACPCSCHDVNVHMLCLLSPVCELRLNLCFAVSFE